MTGGSHVDARLTAELVEAFAADEHEFPAVRVGTLAEQRHPGDEAVAFRRLCDPLVRFPGELRLFLPSRLFLRGHHLVTDEVCPKVSGG